ncbi:MAG: nucleotidyltransferase family protein [Bacteroidota bacterium]
MTETQRVVEQIRKAKPTLLEEYGVSRIGYFGSHAKGKSTPTSDIDVLVDFSRPIGWKFFDLKDFLEELVGKDVDLVTSCSLKKRLKDSILKEVVFI